MRKDNRGFTLVEVVLAMAIAALVFLPMFKSFHDSAKLGQLARQQQNASFLAESLLEEVRANERAEDLTTVLQSRGLTELTEENRSGRDYKASYGGYLNEDNTGYYARLEVDFTADEIKSYNEGHEEVELLLFDLNTDIRAVEGSQTAEAVEYYQRFYENYWQELNGSIRTIAEERVRTGLKRDIYISAVQLGSGERRQYSVSVSYTYTYEGNISVINGLTFVPADSPYLYQGIVSEDWDGLYLFYYPLASSGSDGDKVHFNVTLPAGEELPLQDLHLICQADDVTGTKLKFVNAGALGSCTVYTNADIVEGLLGGHNSLIGKREARRVAKVSVAIYDEKPQAGEAKSPLVTMETRKGE